MHTYNVYYNKTDKEVEIALKDSDRDDTLMHLTDYHFTHKHLGTVEAEDEGEAWSLGVDKFWQYC